MNFLNRKSFIASISFIFILSIQAYAQNENSHWILGYQNDRGTYKVTFSDTGIVDKKEIPDEEYKVFGTSASYSDPQTGELLLFSDGKRVFNGALETIENGDTLFETQYVKDKNLKDLGITFPFGSYFIPAPGESNLIYLFNSHPAGFNPAYIESSFFFTIDKDSAGQYRVNNNLNPTFYGQDDFHYPPLFIRHANGRDWWIVIISNDDMEFYLLDPTGVDFSHTQDVPVSTINEEIGYGLGNFQLNSDILSYCIDNNKNNDDTYPETLVKMRLDRCSGMFYDIESRDIHKDSIPFIPLVNPPTKDEYHATATSPDSRYLYIASGYKIDQFDLTKDDWYETKENVFTAPDSAFIDTEAGYYNFSMVYGKDGRLYVSMGSSEHWVGVINKPHRRGKAADYEHNGIRLPDTMIYYTTTPSTIDYSMGPVDGSSCDTLGLDNNVEALFRHDIINKKKGEVDFRDLSEYNPTSWSWDFDDGKLSQEQYPIHTYVEEGIYNVCLMVSNMNGSDTYCEDVVIDGLTETESISELKMNIYPNPVSGGRITLTNPENIRGKYVITDMQGETVKSGKVKGISQQIISFPDISAGTYLFTIEGTDGVYSEKVVVQ